MNQLSVGDELWDKRSAAAGEGMRMPRILRQRAGERRWMRPPPVGGVLLGAMWVAVVAIGGILTIQRYHAAMTDDLAVDLRTFVEAARLLDSGRDLYGASGYAYSPALAWILSPFADQASVRAAWYFVSLSCAWGTVAVVMAAIWDRLRSWHRPMVALAAIVSLLYNYATVDELSLGQVDLIILFLAALSALLGTRGYRGWSGVAIAVGAVLKSWPGALGLWLLRRGAGPRGLLSAVITTVGLLLAMVAGLGPGFIAEWASRTGSLSQQPLLAYSVWGFGRFLFTSNPVMPYVLLSTPLAWAVSATLAVGVVTLLIVALRNPGNDSFAMWHTASAVVLLMPVSHIAYRLLMLPLVWLWLAEAFRRPTFRSVGPLAVFAAFWAVTFRLPVLISTHTTDHTQFIAIMMLSLVALTVSILSVRKMASDGEFADADRLAEIAVGDGRRRSARSDA